MGEKKHWVYCSFLYYLVNDSWSWRTFFSVSSNFLPLSSLRACASLYFLSKSSDFCFSDSSEVCVKIKPRQHHIDEITTIHLTRTWVFHYNLKKKSRSLEIVPLPYNYEYLDLIVKCKFEEDAQWCEFTLLFLISTCRKQILLRPFLLRIHWNCFSFSYHMNTMDSKVYD